MGGVCRGERVGTRALVRFGSRRWKMGAGVAAGEVLLRRGCGKRLRREICAAWTPVARRLHTGLTGGRMVVGRKRLRGLRPAPFSFP
jgi:hypothetical protein